MPFRFTKAPWTQHLLVGGLVALGFAAGTSDRVAGAWSTLATSAPDGVLFLGGLMVLHTVVYWSMCLAFHRVDTIGAPHFIARHRIQQGKRKEPPLYRTIPVLVVNQFVLLPFLLWLFFLGIQARGWTVEAELPSAGRLAFELAVQGVVAPIVFYAGHRFLHRPWWMRHVHRVHHEYRSTTAWASEYAHPVEFVLGNFLALVAGAWLILPHLASMYLFAVLSLLTILVHHSGYALPWAPWSVPHDWHHYRMSEIFGTTGLLDRLLGTDKTFRELEDGDVR